MDRVAKNIYRTTEIDQVENIVIGTSPDRWAWMLRDLQSEDEGMYHKRVVYCHVFAVNASSFNLHLLLFSISKADPNDVRAYVFEDFVCQGIDFTEQASQLVDMACGHPGCKDSVFEEIHKAVAAMFLEYSQAGKISGYLQNEFHAGRYLIRFVDDSPRMRERISNAVIEAKNQLA